MTPPYAAAEFSGGGFSNVYPAPAYQSEAIAAFKKKSQVPLKFYNQTGRGFPDVSAVGVDFWIIYGGIPDEVGGTSASTPTFAGIVSLVNDARMSAGKRPLGFLNQIFYSHPEIFTDVVSGSNPGGGGCGYGGFTACDGWDPLSGWGSPLYDKMLALAMSLP